MKNAKLALACALFCAVAPAQTKSPDGWEPGAVREEIRPQFAREPQQGPGGREVLAIRTDGRDGLHGYWRKVFTVEGGRYYRFAAWQKTENVSAPRRSAVAEIVWEDDQGRVAPTALGSIEVELPRHRDTDASGWTEVSDIYRAPERATRARVDLRLRWARDAVVKWSGAEFTPAAAPAPRLVRLAAVHFRPSGKTPADNLQKAAPLIADAARQRADLVVFGETFTSIGVADPLSAAEPVPGPSCEFLGRLAKQFNLYVVMGLTEREGHLIYNTAVLIGPDGRLAGKYRKMVLTSREARSGITPGNDYPVFQTRFGKLGIMICYDTFFPEVSRELVNRGAEVIAVPVYGASEEVAKVRMLDNRIYMVTSTYMDLWTHWMRSGIWDPEGKLIVSAREWGTVAVAEVDLNQRFDDRWLGDFRNHVQHERP
jgi:predicted amidohydrolase